MNTPNKLTVARMILVPFLVLFMLTGWGAVSEFSSSKCVKDC